MDRTEAHRIARVLDGPEYDGNLVDNLIETVRKTEQRITVTDTPSITSGWAYEADNCIHCHAAYGHTISCPLLNRESAEAASCQPTEAVRIYAHALGVAI